MEIIFLYALCLYKLLSGDEGGVLLLGDGAVGDEQLGGF